MGAERYLAPGPGGLRKPTDPEKENGQIINQPRYAEHGGLDKPARIAQKNPLSISKPNGGRGG
jgi:hypothetical protein